MMFRAIMKWVASHIRLAPMQYLLIAILLCSCGSSKKAEQSNEVVKIETTTHSTDSSSVVKQNLITATDSTAEELEVTITEYDTSQPTDSATKKPPVKKEIKVNRSKGNKKQSEQKHDERKEAIAETAEQVRQQGSVDVDTVKEKNETTLPTQAGNLVKWICALVFLLLVCYCSIKK